MYQQATEWTCEDTCPSGSLLISFHLFLGTYLGVDHYCRACADVAGKFLYCTQCKEVGTGITSKSCTLCSDLFL